MLNDARRLLQDAWLASRQIGFSQSLRTILFPFRRAWYQAYYDPANKRRYEVLAAIPHELFSRPENIHEVTPLGNVRQITFQDQAVQVFCDNGVCSIEALTSAIVRVRIVPEKTLPPYFSYATILEPQPTEVGLQEEEGGWVFNMGEIVLHIRRGPFGLRVTDRRGQSWMGEITAVGFGEGEALLVQRLPEEMHLYGLGERACVMACRGQHFHLTTRDPESYHFGDDPLYINIPFLVNLYQGRASGILFDSSFDGDLDLGNHQQGFIHYHTQGPEIRLDVISGPEIESVVERYSALTGRMTLPPLWTLGYHQSRWSYETAEIVRQIAREFRERRIPCDAIHFDIDYMDGFRCFTWNRQAFPDPPGLIAELHEQGFKAVGMIDPGIKVDPDYDVCVQGVAEDMFCKFPDGRLFHGPVWPGECYFPDFTSPRVRAWWGGLYRGLVEDGFDGFWNDMNEPTIFGGSTFPNSVQHDLEGRGGDHREAHSVYGMQMVRATYEGLNKLRPKQRNWVFTRSGYAGVQRYASSWTGDNYSEWSHLQLTPSMLINLGLSGLSFTGPDVGGFSGEPTPELFARWISMGAFTPFYRTHSAKHTPPQEPWSYGPEVEEIARTYIEWRYRLLPYIYTTFWQCSQQGTPIMRPLWSEAPANPTYQTIDDQWLLGDHLLISPVLTPDTLSRQIQLPPGTWYDFWTGEQFSGPATIERAAPLDVVPVHVRAGAVLPLAPVRQYSRQAPDAPLSLHLYAGVGESWLYEDDGESLAYRTGAYRQTRFQLDFDGDALSLSRNVQGTYRPDYEALHIVVHGIDMESMRVDGIEKPTQPQGLMLEPGVWRQLEITTA